MSVHVGGGVFWREKAGGVVRTPAAECFRGTKPRALRAHQRPSVLKGGRAGGVAHILATKCFKGRELGALCTLMEARALIVRGRRCGVCREQ